ncbi:MAG: aldo/keto reductase [Gemmatimonadetes bacterium]|mgnify:CR=1 FL=1|jgi:aryl-alcohol dehydrogenase-like predicted oxidoreductase|nr:aldo/keto reductase [Gemmatimonadota bacterium]MBT7862170.1 aldo/keto reductase [Gemmatimonadota bacterium]
MAGDLTRIPFGRTDLQVTRLCQGTAFRTLDRSQDDGRALEVLQHCLEAGVRFFDSANAYGWGGSERLLGQALQGAPEDVVVCTKVSPRREDRQDVVVPFTDSLLRECVDRSRQRLQRDVIDLYLLHQPDGTTPAQTLCARMQRLIDAGAISYWGVSNHPPEMVEALLQAAETAGTSLPVGVEDYLTIGGGALTDEGKSRTRWYRECMLPLLRGAGLGLIAFSPMDRGDLAPGRQVEAGSPLATLCEDLDAVAGELGVTRSQVCVAWVLHQEGVTSVLGGAESPEHVDEMIAGTRLHLPQKALESLELASDRYADAMESTA